MATGKQSSTRLSRLAAKVLQGYEPTKAEIKSLAASVLVQAEIADRVRQAVEPLSFGQAQNKVDLMIRQIKRDKKATETKT